MRLPALASQLKTLYVGFFGFSPGKVMLTHVLMLLRSIFGGIGILLIVPLLMVVGIDLGQSQGKGVNETLVNFFSSLGLEPELIHVIGVYLVAMLAISILNYYSTVLASALQQSFTSMLRLELYRALLKSKWRYIVGQRMSEFTRLLTDQVNVTGWVVGQVLDLIGQIILVAIYLFISVVISPLLTLLALICGLLLLSVMVPLTRRLQASGHVQLESYKEIYQLVGEQFNGLKLFKSHVVEDRYINRLASASELLEDQELEVTRINAVSRLVHLLGAAVVFSLLFYAAIQYLSIPVSTLVVLLFIFSRLLPQITGIQAALQRLHHQAPAYEDLLEFQASASANEELASSGLADLPIVKESIRLENISYRHAGVTDPVFQHLNAVIPVDATTAINGRSGIGKSTLADIVAGLVWPDTGAILLDNKLLRQEDLRAWRKQVAYVTQDIFLFHDTIRNNLLAVTPPDGVTEEQLWQAMEVASVADFVKSLPDGLETVIGDRGIRISGGERQRLAIARALITVPRVLILDESTSALDPDNIRKISRALDRLRGQMTIIVIAHSETSVVQVDHEIFVEDFV
jgi:ATP-binding cassette subfamily C protein